MARNDDYFDDDRSGSGRYGDGSYDETTDGDADADTPASDVTGEEIARATGASDGRMVYAGVREGDDTWLTRGLATMLLISGLLLFLFPEPATSMLGIGLIVAGIAVWVATTPQ